ncbi:LCP family protein [Streptococcus saliviloxodontae]|uniref:Regulatory protein MsrR n=1 Tax=Streptococcus saliviloxodontae TaxID=1349416 RepID=A0ABS2PNT6_9STRE|nr:LCP family protein [Streptococcus saliviloxodontae]MBM7636766.1 LCP family protein required for cell wall assembly [Streptococcus saliviloxodontae]
MNRHDSSRLTRHEQLRYDYLLKNVHYLGDREKEELDYLTAKLSQPIDQVVYEEEAYIASEPYRTEEVSTPVETDHYTEQGLPQYPQMSRQKQTKPRRTKRAIPKAKKSKKEKKAKRNRILLGVLTIVLLFFGALIFKFVKGMQDVSSGSNQYSPAVKEVFKGQDTQDGVNILILGSDQRVTQGSVDARTDTIMVLNVGNKEGKIKLVSFMRDTLINIPGVSYSDYSYDQKLNVAFNLGEQDNGQGAEYMRQALKNNYDIDIKYYMMVDFETFAEAIDTLFPKGVEIDAKFSTIDGEEVSSVEVPDDLNMKDGIVPNQTISVGKQRMDGRTLLNYARFRKDDEGDYGRTKRQQQVLEAVVKQVKNPTKLFTGFEALGKTYSLTSTNLTLKNIMGLGIKNVGNFSKGVQQTTVPENGDWVDEYDMYGGLGLSVDFDKYKEKLSSLGLR